MTTQTSRAPISAAAAHAEPPHERIFNGEPPTFTRGPARRPIEVNDAVLQWATGLPTTNRSIYVGWMLECCKDPDLDDAMARAGFTDITIRHGSGKLVTHWAIETANVFVIADGVQSPIEMRSTPERFGIAYGWRTLEGGRAQSVLKLRGCLAELLAIGYDLPLTISVKSTLTDDMLGALNRQYDVLDAIDAFRRADGKPPLGPPFYACSIPLCAGDEVTRGSGSQTKQITPMRTAIPEEITREYILAHWCKRAWAAVIEAAMDATIAWSIATSQQIAAGEEAAAEQGA